jgi:hypothetical protein
MRILRRAAERAERERAGLRRVRPGTGNAFYSPGQLGTAGTASRWHAASDQELDRELEAISGALDEHGVAQRGALAGYVGALGPVPVDVRRPAAKCPPYWQVKPRAGVRPYRTYAPGCPHATVVTWFQRGERRWITRASSPWSGNGPMSRRRRRSGSPA